MKLKKRLGDLLVDEAVISQSQLEQALAEQSKTGRKLGQTLVHLELISEFQLVQFLAKQLDIEFLDLSRTMIRPEAVQLLPEVKARRYRALVIEQKDSNITIALSDPSDIQTQDALGRLFSHYQIKFVAATESQMMLSFDMLYRRTGEITSMAEQLHQEQSSVDTFDFSKLHLETDESNTTIVRLLQSIFEDAIQVRASDIHIEPDEDCLRIRLRVDGMLQETKIPEMSIASALVLRIKLMSNLDISEKRLPQDGRFHMDIQGSTVDVRVATMPVNHGEAVVMRLLYRSGALLNLEQAGVPADILHIMRRHIHRPQGMILITGPTGSGKTTTLYGMLTELNQPERKIITVEDPVEYQLSRINQIQVNHKIGLDFAQVLRTTLRLDPDVIMVGEMRDQETAEIGLRGALTGHLVLSTLPTNDSITTALRLLDMGAAPYLVASALRLIVAQRLLRRICDHCLEPYEPTPQERAWLASISGEANTQENFHKGRGCQRCGGTGFFGRIPVFELLEINDEMVEALRLEQPQKFSEAALKSPSFKTLAQSAAELLRQGVTTFDEAARLVEAVEDTFDIRSDEQR